MTSLSPWSVRLVKSNAQALKGTTKSKLSLLGVTPLLVHHFSTTSPMMPDSHQPLPLVCAQLFCWLCCHHRILRRRRVTSLLLGTCPRIFKSGQMAGKVQSIFLLLQTTCFTNWSQWRQVLKSGYIFFFPVPSVL